MDKYFIKIDNKSLQSNDNKLLQSNDNKLFKSNDDNNKLLQLNNDNNDNNNILLKNKIHNNRKYNSEYRKKLISKLDIIKNKNILIDIYNIIINDIGNNYSFNRNGIFININIISDSCIDNLNEYIENNYNSSNSNNIIDVKNDKIDCKIYQYDEIELISEMGHKLSNQEKNIIKRIRKTKN